MRIGLQVEQYHDLEALEQGHPAVWHRLTVLLRLRFKTTWSDPIRAIVDTGAPYSVIPHDLGTQIRAKPLFRTRIGGLVPNEYLHGTVIDVECMATDGGHTSDPFSIRAIVADKVGFPLLLGVHGLIDQNDLTSRIANGNAWIDVS